MPSRRVSNNGFRPFCLPTERGSTKGKRNARRTAHRQPHQGGTQQAGAHHHLARPPARLLAPKRLQDLQPPLDLHRLAPQDLRPAGLRFLQVLFGLQEQQEKRMNLQGFVAAFAEKSYFCRQKIKRRAELHSNKPGLLFFRYFVNRTHSECIAGGNVEYGFFIIRIPLCLYSIAHACYLL